MDSWKTSMPSAGGGVLIVARTLLHLDVADLGELVEELSEGFATATLDQFLSTSGFPVGETAKYLRLSPAQLAERRRARRLEPDESERLLRLAELFAHAMELFGDTTTSSRWLSSSAFGLGQKRPIEYAQTEWGASEVHDLIGRISDGSAM